MSSLERKYEILKLRLLNLIEEHADAMALAQDYKDKYLKAENDKNQLENQINEIRKEKTEPSVTIINEMDATK